MSYKSAKRLIFVVQINRKNKHIYIFDISRSNDKEYLGWADACVNINITYRKFAFLKCNFTGKFLP